MSIFKGIWIQIDYLCSVYILNLFFKIYIFNSDTLTVLFFAFSWDLLTGIKT